VKGRRYARLPDLWGTKDSNLGRGKQRKKKKSRPPLCKWPYGKALPLVGGCLRVPLIFRRIHFDHHYGSKSRTPQRQQAHTMAKEELI